MTQKRLTSSFRIRWWPRLLKSNQIYIVEIVLIMFCCRLQRRQFLLVWTIRNQGFQQERSRWHFPVSSKKETTITSAERTSSSTLEVNTWCNWSSFAFFIKNNQTNYSKPMRTVWKNSNRELWSGENHWLRTLLGGLKQLAATRGISLLEGTIGGRTQVAKTDDCPFRQSKK